MRKGLIIGWSIVALGVALMVAPSRTHLLDVPRRAPETQQDRDEMWEYDATAWRQTLVFLIGAGVVAVGIYVLKNYGKKTADVQAG
jgi:hypothetical protein